MTKHPWTQSAQEEDELTGAMMQEQGLAEVTGFIFGLLYPFPNPFFIGSVGLGYEIGREQRWGQLQPVIREAVVAKR